MAKVVRAVPQTLQRYQVPASVLTETVQALRRTGGGVKEAVALWQGRAVNETVAVITKLHVPKQITGPLHFNVPLPERLRLLGEVSRAGEFILCQLHTHPREAFHSKADDDMAITKHTGAISIVIPVFGMNWSGSFQETSVHVHLGAGKWRQLFPAEVQTLFEVIS
jgi:hypothetical protein